MPYTWKKLDNAAKIFPSAYRKTDTQVFRFSCTLRDEIYPELLQRAVDDSLETFELFRVTMRRGLFWYYLESTDRKPIVREEYKQPCAELYHANPKGLLFEVTYFARRINLEVYHVLSDGVGAMNFLCAIVSKYISLAYDIPEPAPDYDASRSQMSDDSFDRYYENETGEPFKEDRAKAAKIRDLRYPDDILRLITGMADTPSLRAAAKRRGATVTVYLTSLLIKSISDNIRQREKRRPISISVPVNCRNFFESASSRNFFTYFAVEYDAARRDGSLEDIISVTSETFRECLTKEYIRARLTANQQIERNIFAKITPLPIKDIALKCAYRLNKGKTTATVSNVGVLKMPTELEPYIDDFGLWYGTATLHLCICTYKDRLCISFTTPFIGTDIERSFFRMLTADGVPVTISTNLRDTIDKIAEQKEKEEDDEELS